MVALHSCDRSNHHHHHHHRRKGKVMWRRRDTDEDQEACHIVIVIVTDENFHPLSPGTNRGDAAATKERASSNLPQKSKGVRVGVGEWFPKQTQFSRFLVGCYRVLLIDGVWWDRRRIRGNAERDRWPRTNLWCMCTDRWWWRDVTSPPPPGRSYWIAALPR